jgi:alpha-ketoglutarate-dependent taurine dioxygenase
MRTTTIQQLAFSAPAPGASLAALLTAGLERDLPALIAENRDSVADALYRYGALLFRGFDVDDAGAFERVARSFSPQSFSYVGGGSPRSRISGEVFTSTEYAAHATLPLHNEASYFPNIPEFVWFYCKIAPKVGGETPLGDMRRVLGRLDPEFVARCDETGLMYVNNLHGGGGFGKSWQDTYQSSDRAEVEARIRERGFQFEWTGGDNLRVIMRAPALRTHPVTGDVYWGNQIANWHPANLPPAAAAAVARIYSDPMHYPKVVFYGDGSAIADADGIAVAAALTAEETTFAWQAGDILLVDNQVIAHGRRPFVGERQIMVMLT